MTDFMAYPTTICRMAKRGNTRVLTESKPDLTSDTAKTSEEYDLPPKTGILGYQLHTGEWRATLTQIS